jgi:deoxyhypusine monooxygenase
MFSLRDMNTDEAALALVRGFKDSSALFRHEIAYVLGQMQRTCTVPGLAEVLRDSSEHRMVRHEAAESLGSIGGSEAEHILQGFRDDEELIVHQSCAVALDTMDYWSSPEFVGEPAKHDQDQQDHQKAPIKYL